MTPQIKLIHCCVCFTEFYNNTDERFYACVTCSDGIVCFNCAKELWNTQSYNLCPVCRNPSTIEEAWYKSTNSITGAHVLPPAPEQVRIIEIDEEYPNDELSFMRPKTVCSVIIICWVIGLSILSFTNSGLCLFKCKTAGQYVFSHFISLGIGLLSLFCVIFILILTINCCYNLKECCLHVCFGCRICSRNNNRINTNPDNQIIIYDLEHLEMVETN